MFFNFVNLDQRNLEGALLQLSLETVLNVIKRRRGESLGLNQALRRDPGTEVLLKNTIVEKGVEAEVVRLTRPRDNITRNPNHIIGKTTNNMISLVFLNISIIR